MHVLIQHCINDTAAGEEAAAAAAISLLSPHEFTILSAPTKRKTHHVLQPFLSFPFLSFLFNVQWAALLSGSPAEDLRLQPL